MTSIAVFALVVVAYTALSQRLASSYVSAAIVFTGAGALVGLGPMSLRPDMTSVRVLAEATLAMILFHDAAQVRPRALLADRGSLMRLLFIGLPLTILLGWGLAHVLFPGIGIWLALFVAAALAPTDAGLGAATVLNPVVPLRVRRILNGESGLNDGLATPVVLFALVAATGSSDLALGPAVVDAALELVIGVVVGVLAGFVSGRVLSAASARGVAIPSLVPLAVAVIPLLAYFGATVSHGNGFIAAFVAGTAFAETRGHGPAAQDGSLVSAESISTLLGYAVWSLFGLLFVSRVLDFVTWPNVAFAVFALTVLRIVPVLVSLVGTGFSVRTQLFIGWFGPRGLATVVFALIAFDELGDRVGILQTGVLGMTVLLSVVVHGITAPPWSAAYGRWVESTKPPAETAA